MAQSKNIPNLPAATPGLAALQSVCRVSGRAALQTQKMKMKLNDKEDCIESIIKALERTSAWRKALTIRYPDDRRNGRAAKALDNLSREATKLTDEQWSELQTHYGWASEPWRNGLNQAVRQIGFHHRCGDLAVFVKVLLESLAISSRVAA
jgi:hypothetical protein